MLTRLGPPLLSRNRGRPHFLLAIYIALKYNYAMTLPVADEELLEAVFKANDIIQVIRTLAMICGRKSIAIEATNANRLKVAQSSLIALADYLETIYVR